MSRPQTSPRTRSTTAFDILTQNSVFNRPIGHNVETPQQILKHLILQYNKKYISRTDLSHEVNILLRTHPDLLSYFRGEFYKNKLNIALKDNYVQNSPYYTIKPMQKREITYKKRGSIHHSKTKSNSKTKRKHAKTK